MTDINKEIDVVKDWLREKGFANRKEAEAYIKAHNGLNALLEKALDEYYGKFVTRNYRVYIFKSKNSFARKIGYDSRGHKYAIGRSGRRISTKKYAYYFKKLQR